MGDPLPAFINPAHKANQARSGTCSGQAPTQTRTSTSSHRTHRQRHQPSWLTVRTAKGKVLFEGTFKGQRQFPLAGGLELLAGRPDLVIVSQGTAKGKPLGPIDQIRWTAFSAPPR